MPKLKTNHSANKRYCLTQRSKIMRKRPFKSHILQKKSAKKKRILGYRLSCFYGDAKNILKMLPY
jgi:large subunit ribosomal protein L35